MNCVETFSRHSKEAPGRCALWLPSGERISFGELNNLAITIQNELLRRGLRPGEPALLFLDLGAELYASVIALLSLGSPILLVEPWLSVQKLESFIGEAKPKAFLTSNLGRVWGLRIPSLRNVPICFRPSQSSTSRSAARLQMESVDPSHLGILTFTSGTSGGTPKGVTRTHGYLLEQLKAFERHLHPASVDWCIFANFAIANLGLGLTSLITDRKWSSKTLRKIGDLPQELKPQSLTCGPAFLEKILNSGIRLDSIQSIHVGGALTDCALLERAFRSFPETQFTHVYGSTEAEPVALMDAREAVNLSRSAGFMQTLALGRSIPEITTHTDDQGLWVSGAHVCPRYWGDAAENQTSKRVDAQGRSWHCMGDRIQTDHQGILWYRGRVFQSPQDFMNEQKCYSILGHTRAFIHRELSGKCWILGEGVVGSESSLRHALPEIYGIEDLKVVRDARHRARIDRKQTIQLGASWLN